ncbi:MAG: DUF2723 domain-containing protein [Bacteroidota bacterium]|nr:DUF2723 domain-containing protein [Bacteroidota bacterium]
MKQFKLANNIFGWISFLIAAIVYIMTIEPTTSFWDCGEFITTANKLQVGHPPGAPTFMILSRFFSLFASDVTSVAKMINILSALASGFTIMFLFWTITHIARKIVTRMGELNMGGIIAIIGSGFVGAMSYAFSDTFWFSAVEAEVYASSSLFTAMVFWAILKWEDVAHEPYANKWIVLIAYLMGLSIGIHLLNLLAIPAIVFVYYYKKYKVSQKGIAIVFLVSLVILGGIMYVIIPWIIVIASKFELFFVNGLGMPFNSGNLIYIFLLLSSIVFGLYYTYIKKKYLLNTIILSITVIIIGYSSFTMVVIRSLANPPMDQNNPETVFALLSYLNREQYGDRPLVKGQYFNSPLDPKNPTSEGKAVYIQKNDEYVVSDYKQTYNYDSRFTTFFPRMYSSQNKHIKEYKKWTNFKGRPIRTTNRSGEPETIYKPTFGENLQFFFVYQIGYMYLRYFMWNFSGRQNDIQGHGEIDKGNWISGIPFIDDSRLGPQDKLPDYLKNNKANNKLYMLPLLLGILGLIFLFQRNQKDFWIVTLLFIFTGLAIVVYLNQYPLQPRERDYAYAGSFYAFTIWIGLGVLALSQWMKKFAPATISAGLATVISLILVPGIMASENWDDHDRSHRYTARDFAYNYLNSCAPNAILFTNGDNDTFPLWYAQEVEGIRTDIRVCNLSYLSTDWYIDQMKRKAYDSEPVPFSMTHDQYVQGTRDYVPIYERFKEYVPLRQIIDFVADDSQRTKVNPQAEEMLDYIPAKKLRIPVDKQKILDKGIVSPRFADKIVDNIDWKMNKNFLMKNDLMVLDLLATFNWDRPVYFAITVGRDSYVKLENYFQIEGLAYRLVPIKTSSKGGHIGHIDTDIMYDNMINKFQWGNINDPRVYLDENNQRMLMNFRSNFGRLALELFKEGKEEKAREVADRCQELMPNERVPFNYFNIGIAEVYYNLKDNEKANEIINVLLDKSVQELDFYFSLNSEMFSRSATNAQRTLALMQELVKITKRYKASKLQKEIEEKFYDYYGKLNIAG